MRQNGHFLLYAPEKTPYAIERYSKEVNRLYGVLDAQLARTGGFVAGAEETIADMAIFPWVRTHKAQQVALAEFPHFERWYTRSSSARLPGAVWTSARNCARRQGDRVMASGR